MGGTVGVCRLNLFRSVAMDSMPSPPHIEATWLDRQAGSGALSQTTGWSQSKGSDYEFANDGRSNTRTTFYWKSGDRTPKYLRSRDRHQLHRDPEDRRSWEELASWNDGVGDPDRRKDNFEADIKRWTQTFCNQLDVNTYLFERTLSVIDSLETGTYGQFPMEKIILTAISIVVDEDEDADPEEWSPDDWIIYREQYQQLMEDIDMDMEDLWNLRKRVHNESPVFDELEP